MKLTTKGRYAVMALADMAAFNKQNPVSLRDISLRQNISLVYLEQIFSKLKKNNIVKSIRGANGGYILTQEPEKIKLSNVFYAVNEPIKTVQCKKESKKGCNGKSSKCITHNLWDELEIYINDFFNKTDLFLYDFESQSSDKIASGVKGFPTWISDSVIVYSKINIVNQSGAKFFDLYKYLQDHSLHLSNQKATHRRKDHFQILQNHHSPIENQSPFILTLTA